MVNTQIINIVIFKHPADSQISMLFILTQGKKKSKIYIYIYISFYKRNGSAIASSFDTRSSQHNFQY